MNTFERDSIEDGVPVLTHIDLYWETASWTLDKKNASWERMMLHFVEAPLQA